MFLNLAKKCDMSFVLQSLKTIPIILLRFTLICVSSSLLCSVSWCVLSDAEEQKCLDLAGNATARNVRGTLQCVRGLNTRDCIDRIQVHEENRDGNGAVTSPAAIFIIL